MKHGALMQEQEYRAEIAYKLRRMSADVAQKGYSYDLVKTILEAADLLDPESGDPRERPEVEGLA